MRRSRNNKVRQTTYKILTRREARKWCNEKKEEWKINADFWIKIIRENLDPFRLVVTNKAILEYLKNKRGLKVLDAGCGEGYLCRASVKLGHKTYGIDPCLELIKVAKDLEEKRPLGIKYFVGDSRKTQFPSSYFDVIISHQTISEVDNPEMAFKEFSRILRKKGKLILLFLHPCFDIDPQKTKNMSFSETYFQKIKIEKEYYLVSGIKSPSPYLILHLPFSGWVELLLKSGFSIENIKEPRPSLKTLRREKWWKENFKRPLFILIEAIKK